MTPLFDVLSPIQAQNLGYITGISEQSVPVPSILRLTRVRIELNVDYKGLMIDGSRVVLIIEGERVRANERYKP
jgi:hypothetical protein